MFYKRRWNYKKPIMMFCVALVLYMILSSRFHKYQISGIIKNTKPKEVWEYVADFSKMKLLNPTILNFQILSDAGNLHDWRYKVTYTERLSHWPYWKNVATADYVVKQTMPGIEPKIYTIESTYKTCFFKGLYCLLAESEFQFSERNGATHCLETIQYQCPTLFGIACRRELEFQRQAVFHNLTEIFQKRRNAAYKS